MSLTIRYMSAAAGVQPAADHNAGTAQPSQGSVPAVTPSHAGDVVALVSDITLAAATDPMATGDIYVAGVLPANMRLIDAMIVAGDIDTATALTLTLAALLQDFTDIVSNSNIITASTVGQAGGVARASVAGGLQVDPSTSDTWIGIKLAAGATGLNAGAKLRVVLWYQSAT